jgi:2-polyprenyl-3-methyl-5-hydroxy-6-metoxy-1,4-benzoquinol methylase
MHNAAHGVASEVLCPVCGADNPNLFLEGDDSEISVESVGSSRTKLSHGRILQCRQCGLAYRSLRPTPDQLARLYRAADDQMYEAEMANRWRTAKRHKKIVRRYFSESATLIDVGCASGAFLRIMADDGWRVWGVEPSDSQYARAMKLLNGKGEIQNCVLQEADLPKSVDLVTMWDVLEHIVEPVPFLTLSGSFLKPGGHLILNVPRVDHPVAKLLGERWPILLAEHLCYFTEKSLRKAGELAGLELIATGQRPASFSMDYLFFRTAQHGIPLVSTMRGLLKATGVSNLSLPVWLGEIFAVYRKL